MKNNTVFNLFDVLFVQRSFPKMSEVHISQIKSNIFIAPGFESGRNQARVRERVECLFPSEFSKMGNLGERQCALCKTMKVKGMINNLAFHELL